MKQKNRTCSSREREISILLFDVFAPHTEFKTKSYGRSKFQVDQMSDLVPFLDSSQKTISLFFLNFIRNIVKNGHKVGAIIVFVLNK